MVGFFFESSAFLSDLSLPFLPSLSFLPFLPVLPFFLSVAFGSFFLSEPFFSEGRAVRFSTVAAAHGEARALHRLRRRLELLEETLPALQLYLLDRGIATSARDLWIDFKRVDAR